MRTVAKESEILRTILDGLAALKIWHVRMNTATTILSYKGKRRAIRQGRKGMADILALENIGHCAMCGTIHRPTWFEVKRPGEKQTADQVNFQDEVEAAGHRYFVVHSWEEALEVLRAD